MANVLPVEMYHPNAVRCTATVRAMEGGELIQCLRYSTRADQRHVGDHVGFASDTDLCQWPNPDRLELE